MRCYLSRFAGEFIRQSGEEAVSCGTVLANAKF